MFNDRRNAKALKAAQGPSLAPKGYKPDTAGRKVVRDEASPRTEKNINVVSRKKRVSAAPAPAAPVKEARYDIFNVASQAGK